MSSSSNKLNSVSKSSPLFIEPDDGVRGDIDLLVDIVLRNDSELDLSPDLCGVLGLDLLLGAIDLLDNSISDLSCESLLDDFTGDRSRESLLDDFTGDLSRESLLDFLDNLILFDSGDLSADIDLSLLDDLSFLDDRSLLDARSLLAGDLSLVDDRSLLLGDLSLLVDRSLRLGDRSLLLGELSLLLGELSLLLGDRSLPVGELSLLLGDRSLPIGEPSLLLGDRSLPVGELSLLDDLDFFSDFDLSFDLSFDSERALLNEIDLSIGLSRLGDRFDIFDLLCLGECSLMTDSLDEQIDFLSERSFVDSLA